jgi:hypothetical protein
MNRFYVYSVHPGRISAFAKPGTGGMRFKSPARNGLEVANEW